jgi:hypothetical protein
VFVVKDQVRCEFSSPFSTNSETVSSYASFWSQYPPRSHYSAYQIAHPFLITSTTPTSFGLATPPYPQQETQVRLPLSNTTNFSFVNCNNGMVSPTRKRVSSSTIGTGPTKRTRTDQTTPPPPQSRSPTGSISIPLSIPVQDSRSSPSVFSEPDVLACVAPIMEPTSSPSPPSQYFGSVVQDMCTLAKGTGASDVWAFLAPCDTEEKTFPVSPLEPVGAHTRPDKSKHQFLRCRLWYAVHIL